MRASAKIVVGSFVQKLEAGQFCNFLPSSAKARASGAGLCTLDQPAAGVELPGGGFSRTHKEDTRRP